MTEHEQIEGRRSNSVSLKCWCETKQMAVFVTADFNVPQQSINSDELLPVEVKHETLIWGNTKMMMMMKKSLWPVAKMWERYCHTERNRRFSVAAFCREILHQLFCAVSERYKVVDSSTASATAGYVTAVHFLLYWCGTKNICDDRWSVTERRL